MTTQDNREVVVPMNPNVGTTKKKDSRLHDDESSRIPWFESR